MPNSISDISWSTSGLDVGDNTSLENTQFSSLLSYGAPADVVSQNPAPNSQEQATSKYLSDPTLQQVSAITGFPTGPSIFTSVIDASGNVVVPQADTYIDMGSGYNMSFDPNTKRGIILPALSGLDQLSNFDQQVSYTGSDIRVLIEAPQAITIGDSLPRYAKVVVEMTTLSVSIYRVKTPVVAMGYINPKGFARGRRTIGGTFILTQFYADVLYSFLQAGLVNDKSKDSYYKKIDQLPPFNVTILMTNEYGFASYRRLLGVQVATDGIVYSSHDMMTEQTLSYMAEDLTPLLPVDINSLFHPVNPFDPTVINELTPSSFLSKTNLMANLKLI